MPPIAEEEYKITSASKSHSRVASRCVIFEMPHDNAMIADNGKLNLQKIRAIRPEYAEAIEKGFEWNVLVWQAEKGFSSVDRSLAGDRQFGAAAGHGRDTLASGS